MIQNPKPDRASFCSLDRKRNVFLEEPDKEKTCFTSRMKDLAGGGKEFSARKLYSEDTQIRLEGTFSMNVNDPPKLSDTSQPVQERLVVIEWRSQFLKDPSKINPEQRIFPVNPKLNPLDLAKNYGMQILHWFARELRTRYNRDTGEIELPRPEILEKAAEEYCKEQVCHILYGLNPIEFN